MSRMTTLSKYAAGLGVAGLIAAGSVAPAAAQAVVMERPYHGMHHTWSPFAGYGYAGAYDGRVAAPFSVQTPTECWTDEGYGRIASCDQGSVR
ncbi:MAG: hypothetical protein M5U07_03375 [Xanthobacteraceae bacterium]|nr:hypothetical protein [Xanthobacteraceae bacterium]PWB65440.1 MAG: hypothetical protein C3F17_04025 [Bradyrhizobiaceae bacterium]